MRYLFALALAACGYDYDAVPPPIGQFVASPLIAGTNDTIMLEGRSSEDFAAYLPGASGRVQPVMEFLGSQRLAISIPQSAVAGTFELRIADYMFPGPTVKLTSFEPRLGSFVAVPYQFDAARLPPSLLRARRGATTLVVGDWLYVIGGMSGDVAPYTMLDDAERARINADGTLGAFESAGTITARANAASIAIGEFLYVIGGEANGYLASIERARMTTDGLGNFEALPAMLAHPRARHRVIALGDRVVVAGGQDMTGPVAPLEQLPILSDGLGAAANIDGLALTTPRSAFAAIVTRSALYVAGGDAMTGLGDVETFAVSGEAELGAPMAATGVNVTARIGASSLFIGHRVYVVGGRGTTVIEEARIDADGTLGDFVTSGSSSVERSDAVLAVGREHAFFAGGYLLTDVASIETASIAASCTVDQFAPKGNLTTPRASAAYVALGSRLCAIGGESTSGVVASVECAAVDGNGSLAAFEPLAVQLTTARADPAVAVIGTWLYVIGGNSGTAQLASIERAPIMPDGTLGAFTAAGNLVTARSGAHAIVLGQQLHVLGGWFGATMLTTYESATIAADGTLGAFATANTQVPTAQGAAVGVVGPYVWMIGAGKFRRASITTDRFGTFGDAGGTNLQSHVVAAVVGDQLFLMTGSSDRVVAVSMTAAGLDVSTTQVATLVTQREDAGMIALGDWLYVLGGRNATGTMIYDTIERAQLR